ncbi:MAG TPA: LysR family transcriptional regulator [Polyangiaceae bacterium]|jgi:DNA-binding transcriptional LysR family regulator
MDLLSKMSTYVRVVESGSFSAAAKQLRISSAAVSRQIATLEEELRVPLLARTTRAMAVTAAGRRYYERCVRILRDVDEAQSLARGDELEGVLRVSAPVTFGLACVAPLMHGLMQRHPGLLLELQLEDRAVDLTPEGVDVAVRVGMPPPERTDLVAHALVTYERVLVASPSYLRKRGTPPRPESLAKHDALMHFMGPTGSWTLRSGEHEVRVRPRVAFRSNALHALRQLAAQGDGIAQLPRWFVGPALASGELRLVLGEWRPEPVTAHAIHRTEQRGTARVKTMIDYLRGSYNDPAGEFYLAGKA